MSRWAQKEILIRTNGSWLVLVKKEGMGEFVYCLLFSRVRWKCFLYLEWFLKEDERQVNSDSL